MLRVALQKLAGPSRAASACRCWLGLFTGLPNRHAALHAHHISQFHFRQRRAKTGIHSIAGIRQHHPLRDPSFTGTLNLLQCNFRFGLKLDLVGNASFLRAVAVLGPRLRQVQAESHRHAGLLGSYRNADRHPAVVLFTDLTAILSGNSH